MPEWSAQREVGPALAAELIATQFPQLAGAPVTRLAEGWDNTVYLVGDEPGWAFRFPRREMALPGLGTEITWLPRLAPLLPAPVPVPELLGEPTPQFPWPFWGARMLAGIELVEASIPDADRAPLAAQVGAFLATLHSLDPAVVHPGAGSRSDPGPPALAVDPMGRSDPSRRVPMARERLERLARHDQWRGDPALDAMLAAACTLGPADPRGAVISHGDLNLRHLLVGPDARISGVIDWGDLCRADPCVDLSIAYAAVSGPARVALLNAYGPVPADRELRARALAAMLCAALAEYAAAEHRVALLAESLAGLARCRDGWQ